MRRGKQKGWCGTCKRYFTIQPHAFSTRQLAVVALHLEGISYRRLCRSYHTTKDTINRLVNRVLGQFIPNTELTKQLQPIYADGIFLGDGKFFRCKRIVTDDDGNQHKQKYPRGRCQISIMHWSSHDIPVTVYGDSESAALWQTAWQQLFDLGITPRVVVADEKTACATALAQVFPEAVLQLCHAHFVREIEKKLCFLHILSRLRKLGGEIERLQVGLNRPGYTTWKARAVKLVNRQAAIEDRAYWLFEFVALLTELLDSTTLKQKQQRIRFIQLDWFPLYAKLAPGDPHRRKIHSLWRKLLKKEKQLFAYLTVDTSVTPTIPKTTNALEGWHGQIQLRLDSIRGFESPATGDNYLNALTLSRRCRVFTDCKQGFKYLNGSSPLQAAGVKLDYSKNWIRTVLKSDQS